MMKRIKHVVIILTLALSGAYLGHILNLPMGILIGSFIVIAVSKIVWLDVPPLENKYRKIIQMVIGGLVGLNLTSDIASLFLKLLIPGLFAAFFHLLFAFMLAYLFTKQFHIDWLTALSGSIPAGMSEIANISQEINVDEQIVMLMHLFRLSLLILILPIVIKFLL